MNTVSSELKDYSIINPSENAGINLPTTNQLQEYENNGYEHTSLKQYPTNISTTSANGNLSTPSGTFPPESYFHTAPISSSSSYFSVAENVLKIQKPELCSENTYKSMQPAPRIWKMPEDLQVKENLPKEVVWMEAYNEKCRECQRLKFDLEEEQSKVQLLKIDLKKQSQSEALIVSEKFTNESKQQIRLLQIENTDLKEKYKQLQDKLDLQYKSFEKQAESYEFEIKNTNQEKEKLEELLQIKEAHFIATIKKFEEGRCSQNTKSTENVQQLQSRLAELEDQLRREKETNILQLQKAMEYQRVSGLPMENCIVSSNDYEQPSTLESTATSIHTKTASSLVITSLLQQVTDLNVELLEIKRRAETQNKLIADLIKNPDLKTILKKEPQFSTDAALNEMNTSTSNISGQFSTLSTMDNRQVLDENSVSEESVSIVPSVIRKIHNPASDSEKSLQPTTSHHEISFENSQAADEAFGNLRKQAEKINEPQSLNEQNVQPSQISTSRKKFVKLNLKSLNNKSNHQQIPSNRSGQIIAQPSDANQQVYSPTIGRSGGHLHAKWPKTQSTIKTQVKSTSSIEDRSQYLGTSQNSFNQDTLTNESDLMMECPVCPHKFLPEDTEQERSNHVNSHYDNDEEDYDVIESDAEHYFDNVNQNF